jgi:hypothetical protein
VSVINLIPTPSAIVGHVQHLDFVDDLADTEVRPSQRVRELAHRELALEVLLRKGRKEQADKGR